MLFINITMCCFLFEGELVIFGKMGRGEGVKGRRRNFLRIKWKRVDSISGESCCV